MSSRPIEQSLAEPLLSLLGEPSVRGLLEEHPKRSGKKRILCIDDDIAELYLRSTIMQTNGYEVLATTQGRVGLKMIEEIPLDLVLLDYSMPDMDGLEVATQARKLGISVPILVVSGHEIDDLPTELFELTNGFARKGMSPGSLLSLVRDLIVGGGRQHCWRGYAFNSKVQSV